MTQALPQPIAPVLIPAKITLDQYHRMVDAGILDDCSNPGIGSLVYRWVATNNQIN
jgi:hypothetical protein